MARSSFQSTQLSKPVEHSEWLCLRNRLRRMRDSLLKSDVWPRRRGDFPPTSRRQWHCAELVLRIHTAPRLRQGQTTTGLSLEAFSLSFDCRKDCYVSCCVPISACSCALRFTACWLQIYSAHAQFGSPLWSWELVLQSCQRKKGKSISRTIKELLDSVIISYCANQLLPMRRLIC